jgi:guanylate kinase
MEQCKLVFLMGVSGSGKNTIQPLLLKDKTLNLGDVATTTTRPMRVGETQGDPYDFVSAERFEELRSEGDFLEYALVHHAYRYGTRQSQVHEVRASGRHAFKQIEVQGREQILAHEDIHQYARSVFMDISDETIRSRIVGRDDTITEDEIQRRLESAHMEREQAHRLCNHVIDVDSMTVDDQYRAVRDVLTELLDQW